MRKLSTLFCAVSLALLAFSLMPAFVAGQETFENEDAKAEWQTSVSKEKVIKGEQFYATLDLVATIRKIPGGAYGTMIDLVNKLPANASFSYDVIGRIGEGSKELPLGSFKMSKSLPDLKEGAKLEFPNEKIPSEGYLVFPEEAEFGRYTLYVRFTSIEANASFIHKDITGMVRNYLPPQTFDSGIRLAEIELIEAFSSDAIPPLVISLLPNDGRAACDSVISITFNKPVEEDSAKSAFSISPGVSGELKYKDNTLTFLPKSKLSHHTQYTVTIETTVRDLTNTPMAEKFQRTFTTVPGPSRWWLWPTVGGSLILSGVLIYFLVIRHCRKERA